jgi:hypothetical protein
MYLRFTGVALPPKNAAGRLAKKYFLAIGLHRNVLPQLVFICFLPGSRAISQPGAGIETFLCAKIGKLKTEYF